MPDTGEVNTSSSAVSFAKIWAGLAARTADDEPGWLDEGLGDDVATLTYEEALQRHGRSQAESIEAARKEVPIGAATAKGDRQANGIGAKTRKNPVVADDAGEDGSLWTAAPGRGPESRRSDSITVRMSTEECARVHARATEAGMTVSAYLRSCVFEAEALRAQVKQALAELRAAALAPLKEPARLENEPRLSWLRSRWLGGANLKRG